MSGITRNGSIDEASSSITYVYDVSETGFFLKASEQKESKTRMEKVASLCLTFKGIISRDEYFLFKGTQA
jgi:hypothetical protein